MLPSVVTWQLPRKLDDCVMLEAEGTILSHDGVACSLGDEKDVTHKNALDDDAMLLHTEFMMLSLAENEDNPSEDREGLICQHQSKSNDELYLRDGIYYKIDKGIVIQTDEHKAFRMELISTHEKEKSVLETMKQNERQRIERNLGQALDAKRLKKARKQLFSESKDILQENLSDISQKSTPEKPLTREFISPDRANSRVAVRGLQSVIGMMKANSSPLQQPICEIMINSRSSSTAKITVAIFPSVSLGSSFSCSYHAVRQKAEEHEAIGAGGEMRSGQQVGQGAAFAP
eukprot:764717-Hanusia_phi.AAC.6